ncbi:RluA family pseudouridine synthase [Candidatus Peregrinibacteria bacterium]|nr:RluA family pseudouridine synthase [Candidatus Peregrinibacteria bacterium]
MASFLAKSSMRLDQFLVKEGGVRSRAEAQRSIDAGLVRVRGRAVKKSSFSVRVGDCVEYESSVAGVHEPQLRRVEICDLHLPILYEDDACLVINKPAGFAVHPGAGMKPGTVTLLHGIAHLFQERGLPFQQDAVLAHRLDKDTTGCLLLAKTPEAHQGLQRQFAERRVRKIYLALVWGIPKHPRAIIDAPIGRNPVRPTQMTVLGGRKSREARSTYEVLVQGEECSLLQCHLATGRTHQVRVHLAAIGHPILGDRTYRSAMSDRLLEQYSIASPCLHAWKLAFTSPSDQKEHEVWAPLPSLFQEILGRVAVVFPPPAGEG